MWHTLKLLSCLAVVATASSDGASIFLFDGKGHSTVQDQGDLHEDAARLLLQQRMLSTQSIPSTALEEPVIELLNKYGGHQHNLFQEANSRNQQKLLIVVEGLLRDSSAKPQENPTATLHVPRISTDFVDNLILESVAETDGLFSSGWKHCEYEAAADTSNQVSRSEAFQNCLYLHPTFIGSTKLQITQLFESVSLSSLEAWSDATGAKEILRLSFNKHAEDASKATQLLASLSEMFDYKEQTVVLVSHTKSYHKHNKSHHSSKPDYHFQAKRAQTSDILSTLMPVCHATNTSCTSATNSCSGHGSCYLKSGGKESECYACKCHKTTIRNADGSTRTIQWGGPACQKEDISTQFFLLGTISILVILAVGGGISMLFSVGQEELPSVISAGVSSVRANK